MESLRLRSRIGKDGILKIHLPIEEILEELLADES